MDDTHRVWKGDSETSIDQTNQWMRAQPWYQQQMQQWGQDPGHPTLTKDQSKQIVRLAQANGAVVDEGNIEVDNHGNFNPIGHKLRNGLIAAGIAGAAALTGGAALGAFGGAGGAGAAGAGAGAAGAAGASAIPVLGGGASLAAGLGGASALPALGAASAIPALAGGATLAANLGGSSAIPALGGAGAGGGSLLGTAGRFAADAARNRAAGRIDEAAVNNNYDRSRIDAARLNLAAPQQRAQNAVRGDILAGVQPLTINGPITHTHGQMPQISGGLSPSLLSDNSRQLGQQMSRQALLSQMQGDFQPTPLPQSSWVDKGLNTLGTVGALQQSGLLRHIPKIGGWF